MDWKRFRKVVFKGGIRVEIYTIRDVARKAGVAVSTVSRVLNGRPDVS